METVPRHSRQTASPPVVYPKLRKRHRHQRASAAALGAEGLAADVTMLIGNGYVPGHAELALDLVRTDPGMRTLFDARLAAD